jgi:curved DNA-binding protein CbpA
LRIIGAELRCGDEKRLRGNDERLKKTPDATSSDHYHSTRGVPMNTLYNLLGVPPDADNETLKKAFREAVRATHPDIHADDPDALSRFRQIVAANALLRDARQRATYDWLLQQRFRLKPQYQQRRLKLEGQQLRLKRMRISVPWAIAVVVLIVALVHGYRLFAPIPMTAVVAVKQDDNDTSTAVAGVRADTIKGNMDRGEPIETAGTALTGPLTYPDEPSHKNDSGGVPNRASKSSASTSAMSGGDASAAAAPPASAVRLSAPPPLTAVAASDRSEAAALLARGRAYLSDGDVALARVYLRRAAERDDTQAALALGGTYDPTELRRLGIPNFQADPAKAREWYRRAADLGSAAAALRLDQLSKTDR